MPRACSARAASEPDEGQRLGRVVEVQDRGAARLEAAPENGQHGARGVAAALGRGGGHAGDAEVRAPAVAGPFARAARNASATLMR